MDDGRCLLDVIDDPDALTSFLDNQDEFGLDSADLEEFSRYQVQPLSSHGQYAALGSSTNAANPSAALQQPEMPSSVLMRLENISPPPIQNDTVLSLLGDRPFTPTSNKALLTSTTTQPSAPASRPIIDLGFGEQEGGEIKEIFPDFQSGSVSGSGQMHSTANQIFSQTDDFLAKLAGKESTGSSQVAAGKDDFSSIFSFEEDEKSRRGAPAGAISTSSVQDVIQQSLLLSGVGNLATDAPEQGEEMATKLQTGQQYASIVSQQNVVQTMRTLPGPAAAPTNVPMSSAYIPQAHPVPASSAVEYQKATTKSIPQVAVVRPQTQPQPQPQTQVLTQPVLDSQGQVISSQFLQAPAKVIVSGQQPMQMPMQQQTYLLNTKAPLNIQAKPGLAAPPASKTPATQPQGIRIMLAPQTGGNIQTLGGAPAGQTIHLNQGQTGAPGQQTVVLHNVQGAVQQGAQSSVPVLQPVITIGATQGSLIFMARPTTVLAPQQLQQLQTTGSGLATIQVPNQHLGSVVQQNAITVNQQPSGKQTLPIVQLVQSGVQGAKTYQTITLPQGYVTGGQTIVIQNPQGTANVLPIAQNQARIVQSGNNQVSFVQTQPTVTYGKVQGAPQLIQPKIVSTAQPQTKVFPVTSQSIASTAYRTKEIAPSPSPASRAELTKALSQAPTSSQIVQPVSSISAGQILPKSSQSYIQDTSPGEVLSTKTGATATSKAKPVEFRHKLYGKISTVQPEAKQALGHSAKVSSVQSQQPTSTLQTILQKVQPHQATGKTSHLSQVQSSAALSAPQSQSVFVPQNSPPATTTVTPSNVNAKGLPNLTQTLPGNNGSVAASVHHPQLSAQLTDATLSSAATQVTTSLSTIQSASTLPTKQRNGGSQLKKQNMFGSRQTSVETAATNTFQDAFLKAVQAKVGQTVVSNSTMRTTVSSTVTATVAVSAGRGVSHIVSQGTVGAASSAAPIMSPSSAGARIPQSIAGNTPHTTPMISALELKAKQTQNIPTVNPNQPMVSALQLKAQQRMVSQGGVFQQQPPAPSQPPPQMAQTQPMISALQLKNAGRFQGQGLNISTPSNAQPMISALEIQQQIQQQQQQQQKGISFSTAQSSQSRTMANVLQAQQMQRQMGPENAERLNQLVQLQQRQNAAQGLASQVPIPRPPSAGQSLPSPQGIPMGQMQSVQPLTGPQRIQSQRPPSRGQPLPSPQGVQSRPPSAGPPMASPHGMHPHPPSPMNQPLQSPQGRQTPRPPSAGRPQSVGHPMPSPQESLASPQSIPASPLQSPHSMLQSPTNVAVGSTQRAQSNPNMFQQFQHPAQGVHGTIGSQQQEQAQPVANQGSVQTSAAMMPQLLQAFDLLKKAQAAQAKGQLGAAEQAHYTEQFQGLLQKHPELTRQLQNLKKAQVAKQNQMKQQQQLAMSLPAPAFKQGQPGNPAQQFPQQPQQPPTSLSASAGQAQLVASSILQATQNISAANSARQDSKSASGGPQQQFVRQVSYNQSGMTGQGMSPFPAPAPSSAQAMNPNYTPNVTIQTVGMGQKDGTQRGMSAQGAFIQNQNQPPAVLGMKRKPVSPSISMPPPPRPAPQQPPPNVSILPSQKQAPLGTVPSVTKDKEKDVFEFDDDDPQPPKIETKFSRKAVGNRAASMTVHHQPALFQGQLPSQQPQQTSQAPALGPNPAMMSFAAPHIKQSPNLGQMPVSAPAAAASQPQTSTPSGQISQLSRMLQSPPQMTPPQLDRKPTIQGVHAAQVMPQGQGQGRAQGQSQPQSQQTRLLPKLEPQGLAPCSQASQGQLQDVKPSLPGPGPAGGTPQPNQFQSQDANPASLRLKQIQQNQQVLSSSFKVKQKSKLAHQQSLNSVQGFIRQLENISNRTPKQEAMLKQLLELQQKITAQASGQGLLAASGGGQPQPIAAAAPTAVAGTGTGIGVGTGVGTSGSLPVPVPNKTGTSGAAVASIKQDPERFVMPVPVPVSVSTPSVAVNTGFTPQSYRPMVASTAGVTTKQTVGMGGQGMVNTAQQYKLGSQSRQPATTSAAMAASAAAAAAAIAQAQAAPGSTPGKPPAPATLPPTQQLQGAQISIAGANATSSATTATPMSTAPASAPTVHQIFTTNIVQLVGKNLSPEQQGVLKNLQEQLRNMTPHQQQEFYRQLQQQLQQGKKVTELATTPVAVQPPQQPSSSTPAPKAQLSPVRARPSRAKPKKKGSKASPKGAGAGAGAIGDEKGGKDVEMISQTPPLPPPLPPKVPTPPPAAADFIRERRDLDTYCVENIQFKSAFASRSEAIQRLLPYHIAFEKIPSKEKFAETASSFEEISTNLLEKKKKMVDKFQLLLYNESMRKESSSEMVMLERMFLHDEQAALQNERKLAEANIGLVESLMPKVEIGSTPATSGSPAKTPEKTTEHSFAQPAQVRPMKSEPYQKTNHDRIRKSSSSDSEPPAPAVAPKRSSPHGTAAARRQKFASGEGTDLKSPMGSSSTEGQYHSSIVSKYGSSDDDDSSTQRSAGSSGGGIRLRLTKSLLIESNVKSRDHPQTTSDSDDSVLASPPKPKRRKSRLEALLSADSSDYSSSDVKSPLLDYRTRTGGSAVWTVSQKPRNSSTDDANLMERKTRVQPSGDFSDPCDVILDDDDDEEEDADVLQEQMDSAVNSILFLQGNAGPPGADQSRAAHPSLADISFDQDDVFDSADDSTAFDVDDYANASFLETSTAVAGLETEFSAMEDELQGIL